MAEAYALSGAQVVLSSRKQPPWTWSLNKLRQPEARRSPLAAHTGDQASIENLVARTIEVFGGIDILVNNAGTNPHFGPI